MPRATRSDVAKLAGVSLATVSHIMNGRGRELGFSKLTEAKVKAAAKQIGYIPRASARNFRYQKSRIIAFFTTEVPISLRLPVFNELLTSAIDAARNAGYFILPILINGDPLETVQDTLREVDLAGAILRDGSAIRSVQTLLDLSETPSVWINTGLPIPHNPDVTSIVIDERPGVLQMLDLIPQKNISNPLIISGPGEQSGRIAAFQEVFPDANLVIADGWLPADGFNSGAHITKLNPDLIFACNDQLASGIVHFFSHTSKKSEIDVPVFGFGDITDLYSIPSKPFSTIEWPLAAAATKAIELLLQQIDENLPLIPGQVFTLPTKARPLRSTSQS
ncbi:LacI family DNA-binding transcriptional regulator [Arcanobacterium hippocoleae]|uniref:LacI family transcriptional regulator n=1 Tax=Arcanobacterium hippocoleae TaxID=149017 RepID=A0ABU1T1M1_9ACTO|nr:LacI family DNA-binding transcriptional regulator [Arcanobacterium hippocoleae]MDR6939199.1 LacI family transcriptional regulator [Arcanobacterium hippocoleae]